MHDSNASFVFYCPMQPHTTCIVSNYRLVSNSIIASSIIVSNYRYRELGSCLQAKTGEPQSHHHLKQRIAVAMQRGNAAAVLGTMTDVDNSSFFS